MRKKSKIRLAIEIALRVVLVTTACTLLAFAVGLFAGILGSVIYGAVRGVHPDMTMAYRYFAAPLASAVLVVAFIAMLTFEVRRTRRVHLTRAA